MIIGLIKQNHPEPVDNFTFNKEDGWYEATEFKDIDGKMIYDGHILIFDSGTLFQVSTGVHGTWILTKLIDGQLSYPNWIPIDSKLVLKRKGKIHSHIYNLKS